ncbi:MAG: exo-alpha-sialidase [Hyphomicrobiales bacterium]
MVTRVLVGSTKGAFILSREAPDGAWTVSGPHCNGWPINHVVGDPETGRMWAGGGGEFHGAGIFRSEDEGQTWALSKLSNGKFDEFIAQNPAVAAQMGFTASPPAPYTGQIDAVWSLGRSGDRLFAGVKPATLLESVDGGATWTPVEGLASHPSRAEWQPGGAGLVLHSIVSDPGDPTKLWVGISAAGVFATEDGGKTWERRNRLSNAETIAPEPGHDHGADAVGFCVHNIVRAAGAGDVMYQQNHHGVFRTSDGGRSWTSIAAGLPSTFGFPVAVHPHDAETAWVLPLNGDILGRFPPGASAKVWRTRDGGATWTGHGDGLPQRDCFFTVLRQGMATDRASPTGVYFGTNSGSVFYSPDEGERWQEIASHLPTVLSVEVMDG